ncbi:MAG: peptide ABC transporter substrate-binding protein, partial [Planctomycetes bacterium]|nr:peptide ABC transporter substrate-binding protein [Planctomycetota bacterium]
PLPRLDEIRRRADYYSAPYFGTYFYRFNTTKPPFDDVHVRRAVSWAIDRRAITGQITRGGQVPSGSFCPAVAGFAPIAGPTLDIDRARAELAKSRYAREGAGAMPPIELHYNTSEQHKQIAEAVAQQLKQALGVAVVLRNTEWKTYLQDQDRRDYQMSRSSWIGDYGDPNTFFDLFVKDGGNNKTGWSDPRYDELVQIEQRELDPAKRQAAFHELERLLVEDGCPIACVYTYVAQGLLDERVMGWWSNIRDVHPLKYTWIEP